MKTFINRGHLIIILIYLPVMSLGSLSRAGEHDRSKKEGTEQEFSVAQLYVHPRFVGQHKLPLTHGYI